MSQKFWKRIIMLLLSSVLVSALPGVSTYAASVGYYAYPVNCEFTGDNATDIISVALSQNGYKELSSNYTKYNMWYYGADYNVPWCAIFISWCANQAGISNTIIQKTAYVSGMSTGNMSSNGYGCPAYAFSATAAQPGDIVYIDNNGDKVSDHVGMVYAVDDTYIYTVEGNANNSVRLNTYLVSSGQLIVGASDGGSIANTSIVFYARPAYGYTDPATIGVTSSGTNTSSSVIPEITDCNLWYQVNASSLNVRMGPATTYQSLGSLSNGTILNATGQSGDWVRFDYGDIEGWVSVKYLKETENPNPEEETTETTEMTETTEITENTETIETTETESENVTEDGTEITTENGTVTTTEETTVSTTEAENGPQSTEIPDDPIVQTPVPSNLYKVTASSLNVRKGPGTNYAAIGSLSKNSEVTVLETSNGWGKINYNGGYGWIKMSYCEKVEVVTTTTEKAAATTTETVTTTTEKATTTTTEAVTTTTEKAAASTTEKAAASTTEAQISGNAGKTTWTYKVTASALSVRKGNGTSYARLGYLNNGTVVTVTEISSNNWGKITYNGSVGWISLDYCQLISENKPVAATTASTEKTTVTTTETARTTTAESTGKTTETPAVVIKSWNYRITADVLNVRAGGGRSYSVIGTLTYGDGVVVTEINSDNWGKINYGGREGWISLQYAKLISTNTEAVTTTTTKQQTVTTTEETTTATTETTVTTETPAVTTTEETTAATTESMAATEAPAVTTTEAAAETTEQQASIIYKYKVTASSLSVRTGPGTSYSRIGYLANGTHVEVTEISTNNWGKVTFNGSVGWISLDYCVKE